MKKLTIPACLLFMALIMAGCTSIELFEKTASIPGHAWQSSFRPEFDFTIKDTSRPYRIFLVLRHNEKYNYSNIYVNLYVKGPGQDTAARIRRDVVLATADKGWLASGMDDIYEQRQLLSEGPMKAGDYHFTLEQIMREDPLKNVLNAGIRLEKLP